MKIVLTCGHLDSGLELVHEVLARAGVAAAKPSRQEQFTPSTFMERLYLAHDLDPSGSGVRSAIQPGKVWQELAADLFVSNISQSIWGWADARNLWTLDFWQAFDAQTRFVLAYCSPEFAVARALSGQPASKRTVSGVLASWRDANNELMRFYNRHPGQCVLVNAMTAISQPEKFISTISSVFEFELKLAVPEAATTKTDYLVLDSTLARSLIGEDEEVTSIYRELESIADIDAGIEAHEDESFVAWWEYTTVKVAVSSANAEAAENRRQATSLQAEVENVKYQASMLAEQHELLRNQHESTISGLARDRAELIARLAEVQVSLEERKADVTRLQGQHEQMSEDNELMLLQLQQMQDEFDRLAMEHQQLKERGAPPQSKLNSTQESAVFPAVLQAEAQIDLCGPIDGDNWYYAEPDGRWAGPNDTSTLNFPALREGRYELCIDVVDAKAQDILLNMQVHLNETPLALQHEGVGVVALVYAWFDTGSIVNRPAWELKFKFHRLISPAEHGSDDHRLLAARVRSVRISAMN